MSAFSHKENKTESKRTESSQDSGGTPPLGAFFLIVVVLGALAYVFSKISKNKSKQLPKSEPNTPPVEDQIETKTETKTETTQEKLEGDDLEEIKRRMGA